MMILALAFASKINSNLYQKRDTKNRSRLVNMTQISKALSTEVSTALIGLHSFTGCDSVSSFAGKGKLPAFKLMKKHERFCKLFVHLGEELIVPNELFSTFEE